MSSVKQRVKFGFMIHLETTYGVSFGALTVGTDGAQLCDIPSFKPDIYIHDGHRGRAPGAGGILPLVPPSGYGFEGKVDMYPIGFNAAYSVSNVPPGVHQLLSICGMQPTGSFTGGSEKYTYAPESGPLGFDSGTVEGYVDGQKYPGMGVYGSFVITSTGPDVPMWSFDLKGIGNGLPTDAAVPAITYPSALILPPKATNITLSIGTGTPFTAAKVRGFTFTQNRALSQRANSNAGGHAGFTPGLRSPTFEVTIEQTLLVGLTNPWYSATQINPYGMKQDRNSLLVTLTVGSVQYNRYQLNFPQAQLLTVEDFEDGSTALWKLVFTCPMSTPSADDDFNIVFN